MSLLTLSGSAEIIVSRTCLLSHLEGRSEWISINGVLL